MLKITANSTRTQQRIMTSDIRKPALSTFHGYIFKTLSKNAQFPVITRNMASSKISRVGVRLTVPGRLIVIMSI